MVDDGDDDDDNDNDEDEIGVDGGRGRGVIFEIVLGERFCRLDMRGKNSIFFFIVSVFPNLMTYKTHIEKKCFHSVFEGVQK